MSLNFVCLSRRSLLAEGLFEQAHDLLLRLLELSNLTRMPLRDLLHPLIDCLLHCSLELACLDYFASLGTLSHDHLVLLLQVHRDSTEALGELFLKLLDGLVLIRQAKALVLLVISLSQHQVLVAE